MDDYENDIVRHRQQQQQQHHFFVGICLFKWHNLLKKINHVRFERLTLAPFVGVLL
jgi:hypothetical protein